MKQYKMDKSAKTPVKMKMGAGVMGHNGQVKQITPCVYPDQNKISPQPSSNRGYDQEAWNYKY